MIKFLDGEFDGKSWEEFCQKLFRLKFEQEDYQAIPPEFGGDTGIEGYTRTGIVFQCYCPEQEYPPKELYDHQRDKVTSDIQKLLKNGKKLKKIIGTTRIKKWCFVTPYYKNKDLLEHLNTKKEEVKQEVINKNLDYIDGNFDAVILVADDFLKEIGILVNLKKYKLNISVEHKKTNRSWRECKSPLVQNLIRKISAVIPEPNSELGIQRIDMIVAIYMDYYLKGIKILNLLETKFPDYYEKLIEIKNVCESDVQVKCCLNESGVENNKATLSTIILEFQDTLTKEFGEVMSIPMIEELKNQIVSSWLLYCPMDFR